MVLIEFAMTPRAKGDSVSADVARILDVIDRSGLAYQLTPMGTIVEGEWDEAMALVTQCFKTLEPTSSRIGLTLKADWRPGPAGRLRGKVESVEKHLGRKLKT